MDMTSIIVPEWYIKARQSGATPDSLKDKITEFCLESVQHYAALDGEPIPETVAPEIVDMTLDLYELTLLNHRGGK